jgi:hypothetical protein
MRVLMTNWRLETRAGSELYLLDVARWLRDHGHIPIAYAPLHGAVANDIRDEGIAVVDDLRQVAEPPDVIHGQHHLSTMTAIATFREAPAVAFCHGWVPWEEMPIPHPAIRRYVAVSRHTRDRVVLESGIDPALVSVLPNFVDLNRFRPRTELPERPRRALLFSNYAAPGQDWVRAVSAACESRGIPLDVVGARWGNATTHPEETLLGADLVFAKARAAMEAMATGAGVILCDEVGIGPFVTPSNFDELRDGNFGLAVLRPPHDASLLAAAIDHYDADAARAVTRRVHDELGRDAIVTRLVALYQEAVTEASQTPTAAQPAADAVARYLYQLNRVDPVPRVDVWRIQSQFTQQRSELDRAHQREMEALQHQLLSDRAELSALPQMQRDIDALRKSFEVPPGDQQELGALRTELEIMRRSTSWRFTAPLRRAGASARKVAARWRS